MQKKDQKKELPKFGAREKCNKCGQTVYLVEKVTVEGKTTRIFHNYCFRCSHCDRGVTLGTYVALDDLIYCKQHYLAEVQNRKNKNAEVVNKKNPEASNGLNSSKVSTKEAKELSDDEYAAYDKEDNKKTTKEPEEAPQEEEEKPREEVIEEEVIEEVVEN
jgi:hypothetical protein